MSATVEVLDRGQLTLTEIADQANNEYRSSEAALISSVHHAIRCGELLIQAKAQIPVGQWRKWLTENIEFNHIRADKLVRLATYKDHLPPEATGLWVSQNGRTNNPSLSRALTYVRNLPPLTSDWVPPHKASLPEDTIREIQRLVAEKVPHKEVAAILGISQGSVWNYANRERRNLRRRQLNARLKEQRKLIQAGKREQERKKLDALARKHGGPLAESYSLSKRLAQRLDEALRQSEPNSTARTNLSLALARLYEAEDYLNRALRTS